MVKSQLHFLGHVVDLLTVETVYSKDFNKYKGVPIFYNKGGLLKFVFNFEANFRFLKRMKTVNYKLYKRGYPIDDGKIVFYDANGDQLKIWTFKDAPVVYYQFKFDANGGGLIVEMIISPAIQNYGCKLHRSWHITPIEEEGYKSPVQAAEKKEQCFVEEIKIENLDEGSKNGDTNKKLGIIYGKKYRLKVSKYKNNKLPSDNKTVKWSYSYTNAEGVATIGNIKQTGGIITFKTDDLDFCGNNITFYAYIKNKENEASLDVFHHYRFRWFDRSKVITQIENRKNAPWKISQGSSSLCGMVALYYVLLKKDTEAYAKLAKELHRKGTTTINGYTVESHPKALEMYDVKPTQNIGYINMGMAEIDWIVLAITRSKESLNSSFVYKGLEDGQIDMLKAVNWPRMMERMTKQLVGGTNINSTGLNEVLIQQKKRPLGGKLYDYFSNSDLEHIQEIDKKHKKGKHIMMMVDAQMLEDIVSYSYSDIGYESHWVVYEGGLTFYDKDNNKILSFDKAEFLGFKIYTWGYNPENSENEQGKKASAPLLKNGKISVKSFKSTFYGYIENN